MCWSFQVSVFFTVIGILSTAHGFLNKRPIPLVIGMMYFTIMEALQVAGYLVVDKCHFPSNQIITFLSYLHIAFQPIMLNAISLYFIPENIKEKIYIPVYILCFLHQ
jgi:hypothetical protein